MPIFTKSSLEISLVDQLKALNNIAKDFLRKIGAPLHIVDNETHINSLIILIIPYSTEKLKTRLKRMPMLSQQFMGLSETFSSIYRDNNKR